MKKLISSKHPLERVTAQIKEMYKVIKGSRALL